MVAGKDSKSQAQKALKATKKGTWKKERKPRFSVVFHKPKTLKHPREPKYPRTRSSPCPHTSISLGSGLQTTGGQGDCFGQSQQSPWVQQRLANLLQARAEKLDELGLERGSPLHTHIQRACH